MSEWMPRGFRIPPYCNQSGMDRIRELHEQVKSLQAELDAARQVVIRARPMANLRTFPNPGLRDAIDAYDAIRAGQETS